MRWVSALVLKQESTLKGCFQREINTFLFVCFNSLSNPTESAHSLTWTGIASTLQEETAEPQASRVTQDFRDKKKKLSVQESRALPFANLISNTQCTALPLYFTKWLIKAFLFLTEICPLQYCSLLY